MKKVIVLCAAVLLLSGCARNDGEISDNLLLITDSVPSTSSESGGISDKVISDKDISGMTTMEYVRKMGYGINLGNTFESCGDWIRSTDVSAYETAWGSPIITCEAIQGYADAGFGVLRIPVAWSNVMSFDGSYMISPNT